VPYFIYFEVSPADIDVNIHPTKTEIKFENEQSIWQILSAAVKDAIGRFCDVPTIQFDTEGRPDIPIFDPNQDRIGMPKVSYNPSYNPFNSNESNKSRESYESHKTYESHKSHSNDWQLLYEAALTPKPQEPDGNLFATDNTNAPDESAAMIAEKSPVHYQYKGCYIMTAVKSGLMIIDQHRADIRIRYERYMAQFAKQSARTQRLLFPEVVQFALSDAVLLERIIPDLQQMGFELSDLGGGSYAVGGVPAELDGLAPATLVRNIVADTADGVTGSAEAIHSALALSLARHAAIPQGQVLGNEEMELIVNELFSCSNVNYTPDGHVILSILPQQEIEKLLG
jgi:DNA mismatch repair protein MutL